MDNEIILVGGDLRSHWAAWYLRKRGFALTTCGVPLEQEMPLPQHLQTVILPFPAFQGELIRGAAAIPVGELLWRLGEDSRVYGGLLGKWRGAFEGKGAHCYELYGAEPLTTANAASTAEGAIALAMEHMPITLQGARCLVIGWGRIGKLLSGKLRALDAQVTVTVRKAADRALAEAFGLLTDQTGEYLHGLSQFDLVFNTVPQEVLTPIQLARLNKACLLIELASAPGGFSPEDCGELGLRCIAAPGLPGKYAPKTAGILYAQSILEFPEGKDGH